MKKNLDTTKLRYSEHILAVPWRFFISRCHCIVIFRGSVLFLLDRNIHGTTKLVSYFAVLNYCLVSRTEKEMVRDVSLSIEYYLTLLLTPLHKMPLHHQYLVHLY